MLLNMDQKPASFYYYTIYPAGKSAGNKDKYKLSIFLPDTQENNFPLNISSKRSVNQFANGRSIGPYRKNDTALTNQNGLIHHGPASTKYV